MTSNEFGSARRADGALVGRREERTVLFSNGKTRPAVITLYVTPRCNLNCSYCYEPKHTSPVDLAESQIDTVFDAIAASSTPIVAVVVFGGEPTLRWDLVRHILHMKRYPGIRLILFSNGIFLSHNRLLELREGRAELFVSFDGFGNRSLRRYGSTKVIQQVLFSINEAVRLNIDTTVISTVGSHNISFLRSDFEILFRDFGIRRFRVNVLHRLDMAASDIALMEARRRVMQWAKAAGAELSWDSERSRGSRFDNYFVSHDSVRYLPAGQRALWNDVGW